MVNYHMIFQAILVGKFVFTLITDVINLSLYAFFFFSSWLKFRDCEKISNNGFYDNMSLLHEKNMKNMKVGNSTKG